MPQNDERNWWYLMSNASMSWCTLRASCTNGDQISDHDQPIRITMNCILGLTQANADWLQRAHVHAAANRLIVIRYLIAVGATGPNLA